MYTVAYVNSEVSAHGNLIQVYRTNQVTPQNKSSQERLLTEG